MIYPLSFLAVQPQLTFVLDHYLIAGRAEVPLYIQAIKCTGADLQGQMMVACLQGSQMVSLDLGRQC